MTDRQPGAVRPGAAFVRLALLSLGAAGVAAAAGYVPTRVLAGAGGPAAMAAGLGIALLATLTGLVPAVRVLRRPPPQRVGALLGGMALRLVLTLGLLLAGLLSGAAARAPLALWTAIGYILFLSVDLAGLLWIESRSRRTQP